MTNKYTEKAIELLPKPSPDAHYLHQARDLINDGNALKNPIETYDLTNGINDLTAKSGDLAAGTIVDGNSNETIRNLVTAGIIGPINEMADTAKYALGFVGSMSERMFTSFEPFTDKMDIPAGFGATDIANKMGVPQVNTLIGITGGQQANDAMLGDWADNPCRSFQNGITGAIKDIQGYVIGANTELGIVIAEMNDWVDEIQNNLNTGINKLINDISATIQPIIDWTEEGIAQVKAAVEAAVAGAQTAVDAVVGVATEALQNAMDFIDDSVKDLVECINGAAQAVVEQAKIGLANMLKALSGANPCAQELIMGELATDDMNVLLSANLKPGAEITD